MVDEHPRLFISESPQEKGGLLVSWVSLRSQILVEREKQTTLKVKQKNYGLFRLLDFPPCANGTHFAKKKTAKLIKKKGDICPLLCFIFFLFLKLIDK